MSKNPKCYNCGKALVQNFRTADYSVSPAEHPDQYAMIVELRDAIDAEHKRLDDAGTDYEEMQRVRDKSERAAYKKFRDRFGGEIVDFRRISGSKLGQVNTKTATGTYGYMGRGDFCSLRCGYDFGRKAVKAGYRPTRSA